MFIDEACITVSGGAGGNGCCSFRREKYVPRGGPDGGDGGHGGSVLLEASHGVATLLQFRHGGLFKAPRGGHGQGSDKTGRSGKDIVLRVPVGTVVLDADGVQRLADLSVEGQRVVVARGGRGGRGNARFASSTHRAPTRADAGEPGERKTLRLELKLLADVGLLGFPNAGKSTLLSRLSTARPKIADYPFTTLEPCLGVVDLGDFRSFVMADLPGLIEGAHRGAGLGHRFLRHVERCRLLLHLVDASETERDSLEGIRTIDAELRGHDESLAAKPQMLVLTKADAAQDRRAIEAVRAHARSRGQRCHLVSSVTGEGLAELVRDVGRQLETLSASSRAHEPVGWHDRPAELVGVIGGTFDPVHLGHLDLAERVRERLGLRRVLLVPTAVPPHKQAASLSPANHREAMLRLAIADRAGLELCPLELEPSRVSFTIDTLRALRDGVPPLRPLFVLGMDALLQIHTWRSHRELLAEFDLLALDRPGAELSSVQGHLPAEVTATLVALPEGPRAIDALDLGRGGRVFHLPLPTIDISSSGVRARVATGQPLDGLVPAAVARYIQSVGLYRREDES